MEEKTCYYRDKDDLIQALEGREVQAPGGRWNMVEGGRLYVTGFGSFPLYQYSEPELESMLAHSREATS